MREPGPLLASGRDADIFEYGPGLVLQRARSRGRSMELEDADNGAPLGRRATPSTVDSVSDDGTDLVMERIDGRSMLDDIQHRPWTVRRQGGVLGRLHQQLHELRHRTGSTTRAVWAGRSPPAPRPPPAQHPHDQPRPDRDRLDQRSARRRERQPRARWVLIAAADPGTSRLMGTILGWARRQLLHGMLAPFDRAAIAAQLPGVVEWKVMDPNMSEVEQAAMRALVLREG